MNLPTMHCHDELERDLGYEGMIPNALLWHWQEDRYSTSKHLLGLYSMVRGLGARNIVEVGFGRSSFVLARAAHENSGRLHTCDLTDFSHLLSPVERRVVNYHVGTADEFWPKVKPGIDFAFLDYFSAEGLDEGWCLSELARCIDLLKQNGMIAVHDAGMPEYRVRQALEALRREHSDVVEVLTLPYNYGLALLRRVASSPHGSLVDRHHKKSEADPERMTLPEIIVSRDAEPRPRIMLIADVPDWIFARHCRELMARLGHEFDFSLQYAGDPIDEDTFDLIYPLEWNLVEDLEIRNPWKFVTGIRSHTAWNHRSPAEVGALLAQRFQKVHAVSLTLVEVFREFLPGIRHLSHGVDLQHFSPSTRVDRSEHEITVGWCGNRKAMVKAHARAIEPLADLPGVKLIQCGYQDRQRSHAEMVSFYDEIDVYICASASEGNNNALMEAAAMARAIVTTECGTVRDWLMNGESALFVDAEIPSLVAAIEHLRDQPRLRRAMGERARRAVAPMDWVIQAPAHARFFRDAIDVVHRRCEEPQMIPAQNPAHHLAHARAALRQGKITEAILALEHGQALHPGNAAISGAIRTIRQKLKI